MQHITNKAENVDHMQGIPIIYSKPKHVHPKLPLPLRDPGPTQYAVPWSRPRPHPKQQLDRFSCFCRAHSYVQQTHRPCNISNNRPHLMLSEAGFVRQLTTWHCSHSTATCCCGAAVPEHRPDSNQPISPAHQANSSKPAAAVCGGWMGQTDGKTDTQQLHGPCSVYYAGSAKKAKRLLTPAVGYRIVKHP